PCASGSGRGSPSSSNGCEEERRASTSAGREPTMMHLPGYRRPPAETQPAYLEPRYVSTMKRAPTYPLILLPHTLSEITGPVLGWGDIQAGDHDLTRQHDGEPIGERIIVSGRVPHEDGRPIPPPLLHI